MAQPLELRRAIVPREFDLFGLAIDPVKRSRRSSAPPTTRRHFSEAQTRWALGKNLIAGCPCEFGAAVARRDQLQPQPEQDERLPKAPLQYRPGLLVQLAMLRPNASAALPTIPQVESVNVLLAGCPA